ncbi:hypothetical protein [Geomesophilobacter sediminis]|uniref:Uncharacterized protein n=1 Tax=Geomesophilobacter sediminis TaxID=2798584 RepID=A0A8J7J881_9BACT|nr:hypothetical protein [Geomesophilobacter sediminis]MBJ6725741.1 hypothetical protein [Geomesophilobacter sediminis]
MKAGSLSLSGVVGLLFLCGGAWAAQPDKPPCGTSGPLKGTDLSPAAYSYSESSAGNQTATFTVSSPPVDSTGACDGSLPPVYGNGDSGSEIWVDVKATEVYPSGDLVLTPAQQASLLAAFSFEPPSFLLNQPGLGNQTVVVKFTNIDLPPGQYDVNIQAKMVIPVPEKGIGVGPVNKTFTVTVLPPQQTALDTLPPEVQIIAPSSGKFLLNAPLHLEFTAYAPLESGAGTGVWAARAYSTSCAVANQVKQDLSKELTVYPTLPVNAGVTVTATDDTNVGAIGTFMLYAEADDNATPQYHTGTEMTSFTVGVGMTLLPPVSVVGRQFPTGSTVPIKWALTDANSANLSPFSSIIVTVTPPSPGVPTEYLAGDGAGAIRWEVDSNGKATQYLVNYPIPKDLSGTYTVAIYVEDICGEPAKQGEFRFTAVNKGK